MVVLNFTKIISYFLRLLLLTYLAFCIAADPFIYLVLYRACFLLSSIIIFRVIIIA